MYLDLILVYSSKPMGNLISSKITREHTLSKNSTKVPNIFIPYHACSLHDGIKSVMILYDSIF